MCQCPKVATLNYVRELVWLRRATSPNYEGINAFSLGLWLLAKASAGHSLIPYDLRNLLEASQKVERILRENERDTSATQ